jgi:peptidoglycan hydrolase CwlO-like protein
MQYEKTMIKEYQDKIGSLEERIVEQKKNYEFIIDSKNEALATF